MRWKPTSGSLCSCNRCIPNDSEQVYYFWAVHTEPTQCPYQMGRPLTHELSAEIPMVFLHHLFVILHFSLTCPLDICFLFRLPPADSDTLAVLTRGVSSFFVVSLCSPIVSDHRGQIQIPKNLCSQPQGPELASLETGLRLGCRGTASTTLNNFWVEVSCDSPLTPW